MPIFCFIQLVRFWTGPTSKCTVRNLHSLIFILLNMREEKKTESFICVKSFVTHPILISRTPVRASTFFLLFSGYLPERQCLYLDESGFILTIRIRPFFALILSKSINKNWYKSLSLLIFLSIYYDFNKLMRSTVNAVLWFFDPKKTVLRVLNINSKLFYLYSTKNFRWVFSWNRIRIFGRSGSGLGKKCTIWIRNTAKRDWRIVSTKQFIL